MKIKDKIKDKFKKAPRKIKSGTKKAAHRMVGDRVEAMRQDVEGGTFGVVSSDYMGYIKAFFRTCGFIFIALGTFFIFGPAPLLKFIPLIVLAFAIISNPYGSASSDMEVGLLVLNALLGFLMVAFFGFIFWDVASGSMILYLSLLLIAAGFFLTIPYAETKAGNSAEKFLNEIENLGTRAAKRLQKIIPGAGFGNIFKWIVYLIIIIVAIYLAFSLFGVAFGFVNMETAAAGGSLMTVALGIGMAILSILIAAKLGRNINGMILGVCGGIGLALGSIALMGDFVAFVVFALVVGMGILAAVPVDRVKTLIGIPIVVIALMTTTIAYPDLMGESVFGDWWPTIDYSIDSTFGPLLQNMRSPISTLGSGYQCLINPVACYQDYQPQTSTKESIRSVEVTRLDPIGAGKIDEYTDHFMVIATVENRGKETAKDVTIVPMDPVYAQGTDEGTDAGSVTMTCGSDKTATKCSIGKLLPGEIREYVLNYDVDMDDIKGGNYITYGANISYDLNVTGQVDVMVMDQEHYYKLARNDQLSRQEQVTEDTGGPMRMGLALMRNEMPVVDNIQGVPVLLYLSNQGPGTLINITFARVEITDLEGSETYCTRGGSGDQKLEGIKQYMDGTEEIGSGESMTATCLSKVPDIQVEQKSFVINGEVTYTYQHGMERKIQVEFFESTGDDTGTCTDTDGGINYFAGGVAANSIVGTDKCSGNDVEEYYCDSGVKKSTYTCPNGCDTDSCVGGTHSTSGCTDSDGGRNYFEKGTTQQTGVSNPILRIDECDNNKLTEYYCADSQVGPYEYTCPNGCEDGACKLP